MIHGQLHLNLPSLFKTLGERSRFQLFGDTMNTTARMESTGRRNRIQVSKATADLLREANKDSWLERRTDRVSCKGLGELDTYWITISGERAGSVASVTHRSTSSDGSPIVTAKPGISKHGRALEGFDDRTKRLIDWNVDIMIGLIKQVMAQRSSLSNKKYPGGSKHGCNPEALEMKETPFEEVREIIALPDFDSTCSSCEDAASNVNVPEEVIRELHSLVSKIASMYNDNPFHNFDHARYGIDPV
jgi:hypothetical protein